MRNMYSSLIEYYSFVVLVLHAIRCHVAQDCNQDVAARGNPAHHGAGVGVGGVGHRSAAQTNGEARSGDRALPCRGGCRRADGRAVF
jgi:hypothetical protein